MKGTLLLFWYDWLSKEKITWEDREKQGVQKVTGKRFFESR